MTARAAIQHQPTAHRLHARLDDRLPLTRRVPPPMPVTTPETRPAYLAMPEDTIIASPAMGMAGQAAWKHAPPRQAEAAAEDAATVVAADEQDKSTPTAEPEDKAPETAPQDSRAPAPVAGPTQPTLPEIPTPETGTPTLPAESVVIPLRAAGFAAPITLDFDAEHTSDQAAEKPSPETASYAQIFAQAAAAARQLHDDLMADAAATAAAAQSSANARAATRQDALADSLRDLDTGLATARARLDLSTRFALLRLDSRAEDGRTLIRRAARRAHGALAAARAKLEADLALPRTMRDAIVSTAWSHVGTVATQTGAAFTALTALEQNATARFGADKDAVVSATNEAIVDRLPDRIRRQRQFYTGEVVAQIVWLTQNFLPLGASFAAAFQQMDFLLANVSKAGPAAVSKTRANALDQLDTLATRLTTAINTGRAQAEAGLVRQHSQLRAQLHDAHRNRAAAEAAAARRRAEANVQAAEGLATAQGTALTAVTQGLRRERRRPRRDFARVVISTATGYHRRVAATAMQQRPRLARTATDGRRSLDRQSAATTARLRQGAGSMAARLDETATLTADALTTQMEQAAAEFPPLAEPVARAIDGYLPPVGAAYTKILLALYLAIGQTALSVVNVMTQKPGEGAENKQEDGKKKPAPPAGPPPKVRPPMDYINLVRKVGEDATKDDRIADLIARARKTVPGLMRERAFKVYNNLSHLGTNVIPVMQALRAITKRQGAAITQLYPGDDIRWDIRTKLPKMLSANSTNQFNVRAALAYLDGNHVEGAMAELQAAVNYSNENTRITEIQKSMSPDQWADLEKVHGKAGGALEEVRDDLGTQQRQIFDSMAREATATGDERGKGFGEANAILLRQGLDDDRKSRGEKGADAAVDRLANSARNAALDPIAGGDPLNLQDADVAEELRKTRWLQTKQAFANLEDVKSGSPGAGEDADAALVRYATRARDYTVFVPDNYSEQGGHYEIKTEGVRAEQAKLMGAIVTYGPDSDEAAGARLLTEIIRPGGAKPDRFDMAMHSPQLDAREGESDAERAARQPGREQEARARQARVLAQYERYRMDPAIGPPRPPNMVREELKGQIATQFAGDPTAKTLLQSQLDEPSAANAKAENNATIAYAMAHEDKRADNLKRSFGRMNREEVDEAILKWDLTHGGPGTMYRELNLFQKGSWWTEKLSGDARNEVEIATFGVARDDRERAEIARHTVQQQIRDAGWLGKLLAHGDYERMKDTRAQIQNLMGVTSDDFDALGRLKRDPLTRALIKPGNFTADGKFRPQPGTAADALDTAMQLASLSAEAYRLQTDRIANAVTTALVVIAAVVTTALTGGAAASIWIPVLVTAGAGLVGMGLSAAIKGERYSRDEMLRDFVVTLVQAATAGLGAAAGVALRGGMPALRAVASRAVVSEKVLEKFLLVNQRVVMRQSLTLAEEALIAGGSNAINSATAAAIDPANRARGKSGEEAFNAGLRGFFGGALGAAVMRPISGVSKIAGTPRAPPANMSYGGALIRRALGTGISNTTTRAVELGWDHAAGHQRIDSAADFWADLRGTFVQGAFQGAVEHAVGHATDTRREPRAHAELTAIQRQYDEHMARSGQAAQPPPEAAPALHQPGLRTQDPDDAPTLVRRRPVAADPKIISHGNNTVEVIHLIPGDVWVDPNPTDFHAAYGNYGSLIHETPNREAALFHNPVTSEYIVVQGHEMGVGIALSGTSSPVPGQPQLYAPSPAGVPQPWKEVLPADRGRWEVVAHYHPGYADPRVHPFLKQLPSGGGGDFEALFHESVAAGHTPRASVIHYRAGNNFQETRFGYDPTRPAAPFWISVIHPNTGQRVSHTFASIAEFDHWSAPFAVPRDPAPSGGGALRQPTPDLPPVRAPPIQGTASAVPDGMFTGAATPHRRDRAEVERQVSTAASRAPLRELVNAIFPSTAGAARVFAYTDNSIRVPLPHPDPTHPPVRVHIQLEMVPRLPPDWPHENGLPAPARYVDAPNRPRGADHAFIVEVSPLTDPLNVPPALAHELMEIRVLATSRAAGTPIDPATQPDALARGAPDRPLSAHDMGRVEQLRARLAQVDAAERAHQDARDAGASPGDLRRLANDVTRLRADAHALLAHLGLIDDPAGPFRLRRIEDHPFTSTEARAALSRAMDDARSGGLGRPPAADDFDASIEAAYHDPDAPRTITTAAADTPPPPRATLAAAAADDFLATTRIRLESPETPRPLTRDNDLALRRATEGQALLARLRQQAPDAVNVVLGAENRRQQRAAIRALGQALRAGGMTRNETIGALSTLRRVLADPALHAAIDHRITVTGRALPTTAWPPGQEALRAWVTERPGLAGVANLPPAERAALFQRYLERRPFWRWGPANFEHYWRAVERSNMRPVVSEIEGTRLLNERRDMRVLKGGPGRDRFGSGGHGANEPGIDIVGYVPRKGSGKAQPPPVDVLLGDDKAYKSRDPAGVELQGVSALVRNLTVNLNAEAASQRAALRAQERQGFPVAAEHAHAVQQMENAARQLARLNRRKKWFSNEQRFTDPAYIKEVRKILNAQGISLVVTSAHGNVTSLSKQLQDYGFTIER